MYTRMLPFCYGTLYIRKCSRCPGQGVSLQVRESRALSQLQLQRVRIRALTLELRLVSGSSSTDKQALDLKAGLQGLEKVIHPF